LRGGSGRSGARLRQAYGAAGTRPTNPGSTQFDPTNLGPTLPLAGGEFLKFAAESDLGGGTHPVDEQDAIQVVGFVLHCSGQ
jgi:hypothetical protein